MRPSTISSGLFYLASKCTLSLLLNICKLIQTGMENDDFLLVDKHVTSSTVSHTFLAYDSTGASSYTDDLSVFLHQILHSSLSSFSSSSPSCISGTTSNNMASTELCRYSPTQASSVGNISAVGSLNNAIPPTSSVKHFGICNGPNIANSFSFLFGTTESDPDQCDYENERLMGELQVKSISCSSSKRSRAAEVHNLSEKRRRSKINEKMKALQNLIPNSNKTDKASMLEEAIEYLKQLQLQVQMLTFQNELRLTRAGAEQLPNMIIDFGETREPLHLAMPEKSQFDQLLCRQVNGSYFEVSPAMDHSAKVHAGHF